MKRSYKRSQLFVGMLLIFGVFALYNPLQAQKKKEQAVETGEDSLSTLGARDSLILGDWFLALEKRGRVKRIRFFKGQELWFRMAGDTFKYRAIIEDIGKDFVQVKGVKINISQIEYIYMPRKRRMIRLLSNFSILAGGGYFLIDLVNNSFSTTQETLTISGGILAGGLLMRLFLIRKKYKMGKYTYLKTIRRI